MVQRQGGGSLRSSMLGWLWQLYSPAVRQRAIVVTTITVMQAAKLPLVPAKTAPTTSPLMGAVARTEKIASRKCRFGSIANHQGPRPTRCLLYWQRNDQSKAAHAQHAFSGRTSMLWSNAISSATCPAASLRVRCTFISQYRTTHTLLTIPQIKPKLVRNPTSYCGASSTGYAN
jgi:hypothetical protein